MVHAHIAHGNGRPWIDSGNRGLQALANRQGAPGIPGTVHGLGENGVSLLAFGFDDDIVGFGNGNAELVDRNGFDMLPIRRDNRHLQAGNSHIEIRHGRAVDEAQADFLARLEHARPVTVGGLAVHQVGVGVAAHVSEIGGAHFHLGPHPAVGYRGGPAHFAHIVDEIAHRALVVVVVVGLLLELGQHPCRVFIRPVAEHDHVVPVIGERLRLFRVDDQGAIHPDLLLETGVAVVPVGAVLLDLELVLIHAVGGDAMEAQARHAVHVRRQDDAVPMDGGVLLQAVAHTQRDGIAFAPAQDGPGNGAVDGHRCARSAGNVDRQLTDVEIEVGAAQHTRLARAGHGPDRRAPHAQPAKQSGSGKAFDEGASGGFALHAVASSQSKSCWCSGG